MRSHLDVPDETRGRRSVSPLSGGGEDGMDLDSSPSQEGLRPIPRIQVN